MSDFPASTFVNFVLVGAATFCSVVVYLLRILHERYHPSSNTALPILDEEALCEKSGIEAAPLLACEKVAELHIAQRNDAAPFDSDRLEMVGIPPSSISHLFPSSSSSVLERLIEPLSYSSPDRILSPPVPEEYLDSEDEDTPPGHKKTKRSDWATVRLNEVCVDKGSMQVKGVGIRDVRGDWEDTEESEVRGR